MKLKLKEYSFPPTDIKQEVEPQPLSYSEHVNPRSLK